MLFLEMTFDVYTNILKYNPVCIILKPKNLILEKEKIVRVKQFVFIVEII